MKKLIVALMVFLAIPLQVLADCDYSKIVKNDNGTYTYSRELHLCVGEMKQDLQIANEQNTKLTKSLDLKDLVITKADQRADLWMNTSFKLEDRIDTIDKMRSTNNWMYFGLGVLTVFAAGYVAAQVYNH